ncbi:hypothetical protein TNCV_4603681 [Trichonephila clavipes]|nr:hypothetical protein TNCV_4603681 [Trichonephila clavipes]
MFLTVIDLETVRDSVTIEYPFVVRKVGTRLARGRLERLDDRKQPLYEEHPVRNQGPPICLLTPTKLLIARRLFRVPHAAKAVHINMPSPAFEPSTYDTAVSVTNHYTGDMRHPFIFNPDTI